MERRDFVRLSAGSAAALALGASLGGCAAAGGAAAEAVVFNPAVDSWLADLANSIAATELTNFLNNGIDKLAKYWQNWFNGVNRSTNNYGEVWYDCYGHSIPPVVLVQVTKKRMPNSYDGDPMLDGMLACVDYGHAAVYFEPWAWQALSIYVHEMTNGLTGQNLANAQAVCVNGLIPSGTRPQTGQSPENVVGWMTYDTRSGPVEMGKLQGPNGSYMATVKATGIWDINQQPIERQFALPTTRA